MRKKNTFSTDMILPGSSTFYVMGIDQSLNSTGVSVVRAINGLTEPIIKETIGVFGKTGMERLDIIVNRILDLAGLHAPNLICMEDVTRMASSASIIPLTELYAVIKFELWKRKLPLRVQNQSQMKKFNFGQGDVSKDSNYMLKVFDATGERFVDDNQADAFMHAKLGVEVIRFLQKQKTLSDYEAPQQEVLLASAMKASGLTQGKFKKLTEEEKMKLVLQSTLLS